MTVMQSVPSQFAALQPFVAGWALPDENARFHKRINADPADMRKFYDTILPQMDAVMEYLTHCPAIGLAPHDDVLLKLALSFVEVSRVFEVWNQQDVRHDFFDPKRLNCIGFEAVQPGSGR